MAVASTSSLRVMAHSAGDRLVVMMKAILQATGWWL